MATFKTVILPQNKRGDGTYNIKIRVIHARKTKYVATQWYASAKDMTRSMKLKNQMLIDAAEDLIRTYREICNKIGARLDDMTVEQVVKMISKSAASGSRFRLDFFEYVESLISKMEIDGREGTARSYAAALASMRKYNNGIPLDINEITVSYLRGWMEWIRRRAANSGRYTGERAAEEYMVRMRAAFNAAKREHNDEEAGLNLIPYSPFSRLEKVRETAPRPRALTVEQIRTIAATERIERRQKGASDFNLARDCFLLSFMLVGMNPADLYDCSVFEDGRITYRRVKTRNRRADFAEISINVEPEVKELVERYCDSSGVRVFNFHRRFKTAKSFYNAIQRGIKILEMKTGITGLQFYAARHSWATIARNEVGIDKYTIHEALNHVDPGMKITDVYLDKDWTRIDDANRRVLNWVFKGIR
ncbi:MAG: site-specific integrase [Muribaculaceae bacterium]|nr:site-specific integrase [Muribaculaceae bacterium]